MDQYTIGYCKDEYREEDEKICLTLVTPALVQIQNPDGRFNVLGS